MGKTKNNYFVVWDGKTPGIYASWNECKRQTDGYPGAKYKGFATREEAEKAMNSSCWEYIGKNVKAKAPDPALMAKYGLPNMESLSVDAACSGNPGAMEYQGVYTRTGEVVFKQGPFTEGTNNIGEFLALVHGLAFLKQRKLDYPIYTDSKNALAWLKTRKVKTKLPPSPVNRDVFELIERAEKWLRENDYSTTILKWHTEAWGEIPADFGRK